MTPEQNKQATKAFFHELSIGQTQAAFDRLHDDVVWWSAGGENLPFAGPLSKSGFIAGIEGFGSIFSKGPTFELRSIMAEGDHVAIEQSGRATTADDRDYENLYFHLVTFRDDKIIAGREYHDTLYAKIILIDGGVSRSPE